MFSFEQIGSIYDRMQDEISKDIFVNRILFSVSRDLKYVKNIVDISSNSIKMKEMIAKYQSQPKVLFAAGKWGRKFQYCFSDMKWECFVDNFMSGGIVNNLPIISVAELCKRYRDAMVLITKHSGYEEIELQLLQMGFETSNILILDKIMHESYKEQYFDLPYLMHDESEVFVDIGGFDGDTVKQFCHWSGNRWEKIYVFEANETMYKVCQENLKGIDKCVFINKGVWDKDTSLYFIENENDSAGSHVTESIHGKGTKIQAVSIDSILDGKRVTFLKADIEGAEEKALIGAQKTIEKWKPKIAIAVYHTNEDIIKIPSILLRYNPLYRFYLRHYSFMDVDTVLYAI